MAFRREKINDLFLQDTAIENVFINEYMATAPGDYVKVYIFAQMYTDAGMNITNEAIGKSLGIEQEEVLKAWTYWEQKGLVRKHFAEDNDKLHYDVEFLRLKEQLYGVTSVAPVVSSGKASMADKDVKLMLEDIERATGEVMNGTIVTEIIGWLDTYQIRPEVITYTYKYCVKLKKTNIKYVEAVLRNWVTEGLTTVEAISKRVSEDDQRQYCYKRIFKALGFNRNSTEEERRIMDSWFDELDFNIEKILDACKKTSGISNPNLNYINKILTNWHQEGDNPVALAKQNDLHTGQVSEYYKMLTEKNQRDAEKRREEVYTKVPRIKEIEDTLNRNVAEITKLIMSGKANKEQLINELKETNSSLSIEEAFLLTDNGFEVDHMEIKYQCHRCKDTGMLETGERCKCFGEVTKEKINQLSMSMK